jgi:hypothetical protein
MGGKRGDKGIEILIISLEGIKGNIFNMML